MRLNCFKRRQEGGSSRAGVSPGSRSTVPPKVKREAVARQAYDEYADVARAQLRWCLGVIKRRRFSTAIFFFGSIACLVGSQLDPACITSDGDDPTTSCLEGEAYLTLWVTLVSLLLMANDVAPDLVLLGATTFLLLCKIISQEEAWEGFSSDSILAIGALFVVARALEETRAAERIMLPFLGSPKNHREALARMCYPSGGMSMVMNNTPIVAMLLTVCEGWAARNNLSPHILLMPLSFSSMLGGMCTLIGTSTNLVLNSQINSDPDPQLEPFEMFTMTPVGLPTALVGISSLVLLAPVILKPKKVTPHHRKEHNPEGGPNSEVTTEAEKALDEESLSEALQGNVQRTGTFPVDVLMGEGCPVLNQHPDDLAHCVLNMSDMPGAMKQQYERSGGFIKVHMLVRTTLSPTASISRQSNGELITVYRIDSPGWQDLKAAVGDRLLVSCLADVVPLLRKLPGLHAAAEPASSALSVRPAHRCFAKAVIHRESPLVGLFVDEAANRALLTPTVIWSVSQRPISHLTPHERAHQVERQKSTAEKLQRKHAKRAADGHDAGAKKKVVLVEDGSQPVRAISEERDEDLKVAETPVATLSATANGSITSDSSSIKPAPKMDLHDKAATRSTSLKTRTNGDVDTPVSQPTPGPTPPPTPPLPPHALSQDVIDLRMLEATTNTPSDAMVVSSVRSAQARRASLAQGASLANAEEDASRSLADFGLAGALYTKLRPGDTLLIELPRAYVEALRTYKRHFASIAILRSSLASQRDFIAEARFWLSVASLLVVLILPAIGTQDLLTMALLACFFDVMIGCITVNQAWQAVNYRVLLTIATSYGLGAALENTEVASFLSIAITKLGGVLPNVLFLFVIFIFTSALSCIVSNAATVVLLYAVLRDASVDGLRLSQIMLAMMLGASTAFATPIGYQTNLMVITPGGYRFGDFFLLGAILTLICGVCVSLLIWAMPESILP